MLKKESLEDYKNIFSPEVFKISDSLSSLYFLKDLTQVIVFTFALANSNSLILNSVLWILLGLSYLGLYLIGHDSAHGVFFKSKNANYWIGQISFLPVLHPFHAWVSGHNEIHHRYTSQLKKDLAWHPRNIFRYKKMNLIDKMIHRFFWSVFGVGFFYITKMWFQGLILFAPNDRKTRRDIFLVFLFLISVIGFCFYYSNRNEDFFSLTIGFLFFCKLYLIPFVIANYLIAFVTYVQHIHFDIKWENEFEWDEVKGNILGTSNYRRNLFWDFFAHNTLLHSPHHIHPGIPFYNLPRALQELKTYFPADIIIRKNPFKDFFQSTLRCKLLDENGNWVGYPK